MSLMILVSALIPDLMMQVTCIREHAWERGSDGSFLVSGSIIRTPYVPSIGPELVEHVCISSGLESLRVRGKQVHG